MSSLLDDAMENLRSDGSDLAGHGVDRPIDGPDSDGMTGNPTVRISDILPDLSFLLAPTGPGSIDDYVDHPLNAQQSKGLAQMLRGFTGLCGALDYAIVDIGLGAVTYMQEGKRHGQTDTGGQ